MIKMIRPFCNKIALHYGEEKQMSQMVEEAAELTQSICKISRKGPRDKKTREHYIEELADVTIMAEQLYILLNDSEKNKLRQIMRFKLNRQNDRIIMEIRERRYKNDNT